MLSVSFGTLQKAPARPRASGSCREGFGGAIRQFRNPTKSCGWKAKGARSEQLMQVKAGGSCRDGFGGAIRQFRNPTTSCGWKAKGTREAWKGYMLGLAGAAAAGAAPKAKLHTQGGPRRRPALARARQGRRILWAFCFSASGNVWHLSLGAEDQCSHHPSWGSIDLQRPQGSHGLWQQRRWMANVLSLVSLVVFHVEPKSWWWLVNDILNIFKLLPSVHSTKPLRFEKDIDPRLVFHYFFLELETIYNIKILFLFF